METNVNIFDLHQKVNSYLALSLITVMTFAVVLYYFNHKASAMGDYWTQVDLSERY